MNMFMLPLSRRRCVEAARRRRRTHIGWSQENSFRYKDYRNSLSAATAEHLSEHNKHTVVVFPWSSYYDDPNKVRQ